MVAIEPNSWRTTSFAQDSTAFICYCDVPDDSGSCCHYLAEVDVPNSSSSSRNAFSKEKEVLEGVLGWAIAYGNCDEWMLLKQRSSTVLHCIALTWIVFPPLSPWCVRMRLTKMAKKFFASNKLFPADRIQVPINKSVRLVHENSYPLFAIRNSAIPYIPVTFSLRKRWTFFFNQLGQYLPIYTHTDREISLWV